MSELNSGHPLDVERGEPFEYVESSRFTVFCNVNAFPGDTMAEIHRSTCRAIGRKDYHDHPATYVGHADTLRDALDIAVDEEDREMGYDDSHARLEPCVTKDDRATLSA